MQALKDAQSMDKRSSNKAESTKESPDHTTTQLREMEVFVQSIEEILKPITQHITTYRQLSDEGYRKMMTSLNRAQHMLLLNVLSAIKANAPPFYIFINGETATGKTYVIKSIFQTLNRYLDCIAPVTHVITINPATFEKQPVKLNILLSALEAKSAIAINGTTIHQAFCIHTTVESHGALLQLDTVALEKMRRHYRNLRLIIIDDIHLVSLDLFYHIDTRLRQIFNKDLVFGGISMIVLGDLNRTPASISAPIFANNQSPNTLPCQATNSLWENFRLLEFKEVFENSCRIYPSLDIIANVAKNTNSAKEMKRMSQTKAIAATFNVLKNEHVNLHIMYHNIDATLSTCLQFIKSDYGFMNAGIIILSKCHTNPKNNYNLLLNGYTLMKLTGSEKPNSTNGTAVYVHNKYIDSDRPSVRFHNDNSFNGLYNSNDELEIGAIRFLINGVHVHLCYFTIHLTDISKSWKDFKTFIEQNIPRDEEKKQKKVICPLKPLILVGTLKYPRNLDQNRLNDLINRLPDRYGLINYVNSCTHDLNYRTDFCFSNCAHLLSQRVDVYESYFSHHKPIAITIYK